jgi:hypothetical protein
MCALACFRGFEEKYDKKGEKTGNVKVNGRKRKEESGSKQAKGMQRKRKNN